MSDRPKVLVVDDEMGILNTLEILLRREGFAVTTAPTGREALERMEESRPDVILTDLNMPDITGIEFTKGVRQWYSDVELPIIMVTTQNEGQDNETAYASGVNDILQKPFTEAQIGKALAKFAGRQPPF